MFRTDHTYSFITFQYRMAIEIIDLKYKTEIMRKGKFN
jgi:hypothetical protein